MKWSVEEFQGDLPGQHSLGTHLAGGRRVLFDSIEITKSTEGFLAGSAERIWDEVVGRNGQRSTSRWSGCPAFMIPPVSLTPDKRILPTWKVQAWLISEPTSPDAHGSHLVLVFFCNDIASRNVTDLIGEQLASMDENWWREHAEDFWY